MKGVILAGGTGSRLYPLTKVTNKHLLPVYNEPMIYYPIKTLKQAGVTDILIIVGGESTGDFLKLLGSGEELGVNITYRAQVGSGGIPTALALAEDFADANPIMVVLGDNVMGENVKSEVQNFKQGAHIFVKKVHDPERYGVVEVEGTKIKSIEEKPKTPKSELVATGVYIFDSHVFHLIRELKPSKRGETEISEVLRYYLENEKLSYSKIKGFWTDAGTLESLYHANTIVREKHHQFSSK